MTLNIKTYANLKHRQNIDRDNCTRVLDRQLREVTETHNYTRLAQEFHKRE